MCMNISVLPLHMLYPFKKEAQNKNVNEQAVPSRTIPGRYLQVRVQFIKLSENVRKNQNFCVFGYSEKSLVQSDPNICSA